MNPEVSLVNSQMADMSRILRKMSAAMQHSLLAPALAAGAEPIARATMNLAPIETGALKAGMTVKIKKFADGGAIALIGVNRRFFSARRRPSKYVHLLEFGHIQVAPHQKGKTLRKGTAVKTGFIAPRPFVRPGFWAGQALARQIIWKELDNNLRIVRDREVAAGRHSK